MPAYLHHRSDTRPRERIYALFAVALVQIALAIVLLIGLRVEFGRTSGAVQRLIDVSLLKPPPPQPLRPPPKPQRRAAAAPKATPDKLGGSPGPQPTHAAPSVAPVVAIRPSAPPAGGGSGTGPALGSGSGGGAGGNGYGDDGGTDLEQIAGEITSRDYPRDLREAGIGGRVGFVFTVQANGRVGRCTITRSSGVPELDALTCRLVQQRFVYRPSTDRNGRPIGDEVEGEHDWIAGSR